MTSQIVHVVDDDELARDGAARDVLRSPTFAALAMVLSTMATRMAKDTVARSPVRTRTLRRARSNPVSSANTSWLPFGSRGDGARDPSAC
jgi:hypothetical protein